MGKKRKIEDNEEEIKRKIKKWERKLMESAKTKSRRRIIYSSDEDESLVGQSEGSPAVSQIRDPPRELQPPLPGPIQIVAEIHQPPSPRRPQSAHMPVSPAPSPSLYQLPSPNEPSSPYRPPSPNSPSPPRSPLFPPPRTRQAPLEAIDQVAFADNEIAPEEIELDGDILQLLGDAPKSDTPLGPPIHKDVASRWQEILAKGLTKEVKDKIFEEYLVPRNCDFLVAPTLNPEAKAALSDPLVKRDAFLMQKQKQLGIALAALSSATGLILSNETSKQKLLKPISDACRILCDNHYIETKSRRNLVISSTNMQLKDTLIQSVRDNTWLFGDNISEKLKAAKTIQKSADDLKNQPKQVSRPNYVVKNNRGRLNYKPQHRKTDNKHTDSGRGRQPSRAPRGTYRSTRRSPPPPPPLRRSAHK